MTVKAWRYPGCDCCFTCALTPFTFTGAGGWVAGESGGSIEAAVDHLNSLSISFRRPALRGIRYSFDYSVSSGTLGINNGVSITSDGKLYTQFHPLEFSDISVPTSGTIEVLASYVDPGIEEDAATNTWHPFAQEIYVGGSWVCDLPAGTGLGFDSEVKVSVTAGGSASVSNFSAEKVYGSRGCHPGPGTYWWPPGKPTSLTVACSWRNRAFPVPGESELPCEDCPTWSGTYTLQRVEVPPGTIFAEIGGGPFVSPVGALQLWISTEPMGGCSIYEDEPWITPPSEDVYLYLYTIPEQAGNSTVLSIGVCSNYTDLTWGAGLSFVGINTPMIFNGFTQGDGTTADYYLITDSTIDFENYVPVFSGGGDPCVLEWLSVTANYG